jgi:hypothetical protein
MAPLAVPRWCWWTLLQGTLVAAGPLPAQSGRDSAERVLRVAAMAMGRQSVETIHTIEAVAECQGPRGPYRTTVLSARDGRAVFQQDFPSGRRYRAVLGPNGGEEYDSDSGHTVQATPLTYVIASGHEIHMLTIAPATQYGAPTGAREVQFQARPAIGVVFRDRLGDEVIANYDPRDTTLLGFTLPGPAGQSIALVVWRWRRVDGVSLPTRAVYWQGKDAYRFRFTRIRLNVVQDSAFAISADSP